GIPTFIDKPFASSTADASKIVSLAKRKGVPITNFSTVRFGKGIADFKKQLKKIGRVGAVVVSGPGSTRDPYDGIFFYAVHQVELLLEAFGNDVKSARGLDYDGSLVAALTFRNGMIATIHEINTGWPVFRAVAYGEKGEAHFDGSKGHDGFFLGAKVFTKMFKTGKMPYPYDELTVSTRALVAIDKSMKDGGRKVAIR
ncbi:MAG: Gfo/Idh/MocA family oxidoreductase, partial [Planctomycetota bacterium]